MTQHGLGVYHSRALISYVELTVHSNCALSFSHLLFGHCTTVCLPMIGVWADFDVRGALHAAAHAVLNILPLFVRCAPTEVHTECAHPSEQHERPSRILVFDRHWAGGLGVAHTIQPVFGELLAAALAAIQLCECRSKQGCPLCVQRQTCSEYNEVLCKKSAAELLLAVLHATPEPTPAAVSREKCGNSGRCEQPPQPVPYHIPAKAQTRLNTSDDGHPVPLSTSSLNHTLREVVFEKKRKHR